MASDITPAPTGAPKPKPVRISRRTLSVLLAVAFVVVALLVLWFVHYETRGRYYEGTDDAYIRADAVTVSPRISGYVAQVFVGDNQDVPTGAPLVRIDSRDYDAQAAQYRAQIDVAQANVANVRAGLREQQSAIAQGRAQLASSRADAAFAAGEVARYTPLAASGAETREKLSSLRNQATQAARTADAQAAALDQAERRIASLDAQVLQAKAQGEAARAQLAAADVNVGSAIVRASVAGRIGDKSVRIGQFVQSGLRMMSVVPLQAIYISANFKETQVGLMRPGQPAEIEVDALPGVRLHGHVESLSPGTGAQFSLLPPQNATGNFTKIVQRVPVRIAIDAGPEARRVLVPGMSLAVTVDTYSARADLAQIRHQEDAQGRRGQ
jgi:membrane fusion protein (multidrug efflux system)